MPVSSAVLFGSYDADLHPRVAVLRDGLRAHGWSVRELNMPLGASTADKVAAAGSPRAAARLLGRQVASWRRLTAGARHVEAPDVVVVGYLGHGDVHLARALFPRATLVLDHLVGLADTVADRRLGGSARMRALAAVDHAALRVADVVVVDTVQQAGQLPGWARAKAVVVPVGASAEWRRSGAGEFPPADGLPGPARRPGVDGLPRPGGLPRDLAAGADPDLTSADATQAPVRPLRVVFFGLFTPLQGARTIGEAIARLPRGYEFTMVGRGQDWQQVRDVVGRDDRVRWLDWVDPAELPDLVAGHDVCLGIFGTGAKAQRVVPTKVYQGMAAGCAIVTGDTPATDGLGLISVPPGDPEALAGALQDLTDPQRLARAREHSRTMAERFTPEAVTAELVQRMGAMPARAPLPPLTMNAWLRWDVISAELVRRRLDRVLEIGPGEGAMATRLARGRSYSAVESSARTRRITADRLAALRTPGRVLGSLEELGADERFDLVCAFEVLEHIDDDRAALAQWVGRLAPGGTLLLSTPAGPRRMGPHDVIAGHFRRYSADGLGELARGVGLVDVRVVHVGFPVGYALEAVRNAAASRRLAGQGGPGLPTDDVAGRTEASSSIMQPPAWSGPLMRVASAPFRWVQRTAPTRGTGLVLIARAR